MSKDAWEWIHKRVYDYLLTNPNNNEYIKLLVSIWYIRVSLSRDMFGFNESHVHDYQEKAPSKAHYTTKCITKAPCCLQHSSFY